MDERTKAILADTKAHGFEFVLENLAKNDVALRQVPVIEVTDSAKFDALKPGVVLDAINGTSVKVSSQRVSRDYAYDNQRQATDKRDEAIRQKNVEWILGIKTTRTVEVQVFVGPEGQKFSTIEEAQDAWLAWQAQQ